MSTTHYYMQLQTTICTWYNTQTHAWHNTLWCTTTHYHT